MAKAEGWPKNRRLLGTRVRRLDGPAKATGRAKYSYDINRKGMLHGRILRSPHAHAKIKSIDTAGVKQVPGVKALVIIGVAKSGTVAEIDGDKLTYRVAAAKKGKGKKDDPNEPKEGQYSVRVTPTVTLISKNKVVKLSDLKPGDPVTVENEQDAVGRELFYAGDEIAAVAADTEEHALDALRAIKVEFQELDHIVSEDEVRKTPDKKTTPGGGRGNLSPGKEATKGDVDAGFKDAEAVAEGTYGVPVISHQCLESHGLVAEWDAEGGLTVWASTQATVATAQQLAGRFGVPASKVKCVTHYMGGGFGSKFGPDIQGFTAADLARRAGAAVKIMLDREEEVTTAGNRPSAFGTVKIGGKKDGTITAFAVDCYGTPGYSGGATVNINLLPYVYLDAIANWKRAAAVTLINAGGARAMRAPGHPQNCVLTEFAVDDLAAKLGIDPLVIRRKNLPPNSPDVKAKDPVAWAGRRNDVYNEELDIALQLSGWKERWHPPGQGKMAGPIKHGIGMALHTWGGFASGQMNEVNVTISKDGSVTAQTSSQDLGTAQRTVNAIVTAEILGLVPTDIVTHIGESPFGPSSGSGGSTTCPSQAPATLLAAQAARDDLFKKVGPKLGADPKDLAIEPGKVVNTKSRQGWAWKEFCARLGMDEAKGKGEWSQGISNQEGNENISSGQVGGVQVAEVLVDSETGAVRVKHMVAVQDCGLVVNKLACESQVAGGVIMGLNYALFEECIRDRVTGRQVNPDMEFYKLGGLGDMPKITVHMMDMPERGVIGIGEPPTISTAAAIGNAVFNAIGVRVGILPLTPKRVLDALAKGGKAK
ncbi:MAG TPA: xanthine dehydrogenase family protein molybdopterin-binding subunit [Gemmataceae bacterium]|nr:xanthine dehydrogenase family protein molybdopterin-binding subunit [Gemmataceae bacterium]